VVSRGNQNALTEVDAWNRSSRVPAPRFRRVALQTLLTQPPTSIREHSFEALADDIQRPRVLGGCRVSKADFTAKQERKRSDSSRRLPTV